MPTNTSCLGPVLSFFFLLLFQVPYVATRPTIDKWSMSVHDLANADDHANRIRVRPYVIPAPNPGSGPAPSPLATIRGSEIANAMRRQHSDVASLRLAVLTNREDLATDVEARAEAGECIRIITEVRLQEIRSQSLAASGVEGFEEIPLTTMTTTRHSDKTNCAESSKPSQGDGADMDAQQGKEEPEKDHQPAETTT